MLCWSRNFIMKMYKIYSLIFIFNILASTVHPRGIKTTKIAADTVHAGKVKFWDVFLGSPSNVDISKQHSRRKRGTILLMPIESENQDSKDMDLAHKAPKNPKTKRCKTPMRKIRVSLPINEKNKLGTARQNTARLASVNNPNSDDQSSKQYTGKPQPYVQHTSLKNPKSMLTNSPMPKSLNNRNNIMNQDEDTALLSAIRKRLLPLERKSRDKSRRNVEKKYVCYCKEENYQGTCPGKDIQQDSSSRKSWSANKKVGANNNAEILINEVKKQRTPIRESFNFPRQRLPSPRPPTFGHGIPHQPFSDTKSVPDVHQTFYPTTNIVPYLSIFYKTPSQQIPLPLQPIQNEQPITNDAQSIDNRAFPFVGQGAPIVEERQRNSNQETTTRKQCSQPSSTIKTSQEDPHESEAVMDETDLVGMSHEEEDLATKNDLPYFPEEGHRYSSTVSLDSPWKNMMYNGDPRINMEECIKLYGLDVCVLSATPSMTFTEKHSENDDEEYSTEGDYDSSRHFTDYYHNDHTDTLYTQEADYSSTSPISGYVGLESPTHLSNSKNENTFSINHGSTIPIENNAKFNIGESEESRDSAGRTNNSDKNPQNYDHLEEYIPNDFYSISTINPSREKILDEFKTPSYNEERTSQSENVGNPVNIDAKLFSLPQFTEFEDRYTTVPFSYALSDNRNANTDTSKTVGGKSYVQANNAESDAVTLYTELGRDYPNNEAITRKDENVDYSEIREITDAYFTSKAYVSETNMTYIENYPPSYEISITSPTSDSFSNSSNYVNRAQNRQQLKEDIESYTMDNKPMTSVDDDTINEDDYDSQNLSKIEKNIESVNEGEQYANLGKSKVYTIQEISPISHTTDDEIFITEDAEDTKDDHHIRKELLGKSVTTSQYAFLDSRNEAETLEKIERDEESTIINVENSSAIEQNTETSVTDLLGMERERDLGTEFSVEYPEETYIDTDNISERIMVANEEYLDTTDAHIISATPFKAALSKSLNALVPSDDLERNEETNTNLALNNLEIHDTKSSPQIANIELNSSSMSNVNQIQMEGAYEYSTTLNTLQNDNIAINTSSTIDMASPEIPINGGKDIVPTSNPMIQQNIDNNGHFTDTSFINEDTEKAANLVKHTLPFCDNTVLQNTIKTVINNFATEESTEMDDKIIDTETVGATGENLSPEILDIPNLKGILSLPEIEGTIIHKVKDLLSKITEVSKYGLGEDSIDNVIRSSIRHMMSAVPEAQTNLPPMTVQERVFKNGVWTTHLVTLSPVLPQSNRSPTTAEKVRGSIQSFLHNPAVTLQAAKHYPVQNMIVESVKRNFGPEMPSKNDDSESIDEIGIRSAFEGILDEIEKNVKKANNGDRKNTEESAEVENYDTASGMVTAEDELKSTTWNILESDIDDNLGLPVFDKNNAMETSTENISSQQFDDSDGSMEKSHQNTSNNKNSGTNESLVKTWETDAGINSNEDVLNVRYDAQQQYNFTTTQPPEKLKPVYEETTSLLENTEQVSVPVQLDTQGTLMPNRNDLVAKKAPKPLDYMYLGESSEFPEDTELSSLKITDSKLSSEYQPQTHKYNNVFDQKTSSQLPYTNAEPLQTLNDSNMENVDIISNSNNMRDGILSSDNTAYTTHNLNTATEDLRHTSIPTLNTFLKLTNNLRESSTTYFNTNIGKSNVVKTVSAAPTYTTIANLENTMFPRNDNGQVSDAIIVSEHATKVPFEEENMEITTEVSNIHTTSESSKSTDLDEYIGLAHITINKETEPLNKSPMEYSMNYRIINYIHNHPSSSERTETSSETTKQIERTQNNTTPYEELLDTEKEINDVVELKHTLEYPENNSDGDIYISNMKNPAIMGEKATTMQSIYTDHNDGVESTTYTNVKINMYDEPMIGKEMEINKIIDAQKAENSFGKYNITTQKNYKFDTLMEDTQATRKTLKPEISGTTSIDSDDISTLRIDDQTPARQDFTRIQELTTKIEKTYTETMRYYQTNPESSIVEKTLSPEDDNASNEDVEKSYENTLTEKPTTVVSKARFSSGEEADFTYLGKISIQNNTDLRKNVSELQKSELYYLGDGVKLPLEIRKLQDGSYALSLSRKICKHILERTCPCCVPREGNVVHTIKRHNNMNKRNMEGLRKSDSENQRKNAYRDLRRTRKNYDRRLVRSIVRDRSEKYDTYDQSSSESNTISMPVIDFAKKYNLSVDTDQLLSNQMLYGNTNDTHTDLKRDKSSQNLATLSDKITKRKESMVYDKSSTHKEKNNNTIKLLKSLSSIRKMQINGESDQPLNTITTKVESRSEPREIDVSSKDFKIKDQMDTKKNRNLRIHYNNNNESNYGYKTLDKFAEGTHFDKNKQGEYSSYKYQRSIVETTKKRMQIATMVLNWLKEIFININSARVEKIVR